MLVIPPIVLQEEGIENVTVNALCPGGIRTKLQRYSSIFGNICFVKWILSIQIFTLHFCRGVLLAHESSLQINSSGAYLNPHFFSFKSSAFNKLRFLFPSNLRELQHSVTWPRIPLSKVFQEDIFMIAMKEGS